MSRRPPGSHSAGGTISWATTQKYGTNTLAQQFPSFQISGGQAQGNVRVEARSPSGRVHDMGVNDSSGVYTANFTPTEVGDWMISILYENKHIQGSPFNVRVYDAAKVKVFGLEGATVGKMFSFSADCTGAGDGELSCEIHHNGQIVPCHITEDNMNRGCYRVSFTPNGSGIYSIKVLFAGMEVPGCPYTLEIVDSAAMTAMGDGLSSVEVNRRAHFIINTHGASGGEPQINITSPTGHRVQCQVFNQHDGTYRVEYQVSEVGEYLIDVLYYGKHIAGSPFRVQGYDWNRIQITNLKQQGMVGRLCEFDIDAAHAGSGNLEIMVNEGTIPCSVQNRGNRQFHASFMPKDAIIHLIQMKFNGREVPGSPWRVEMRGMTNVTVQGPGLQLVPIHVLTGFEVRTGKGFNDCHVSSVITAPSGRILPANVLNTYSGIYRVEYTAMEVGNHLVEVLVDGAAVQGSPFTMKAYDPSCILVSQIPPGIVGRPVEFTIDVTQAGEGQLEIMVNRGAVPNVVKMLRKGVFLVCFTPRATQAHIVDIKFNGELIPGCPFNVPILDASRVTVAGDGIRQVAVNKSSYFRVNTQSAGEADLTVRVTAPNGELVPAKIVQQPDMDYKVEYSSKYTGRHTVEILYAGQPIMGSPFYVEIYDPNKIRVEGVQTGNVGEPIGFDIIRNEAGKAEMSLSITSPSGKNVPYDIMPTPRGEHITYTPYEVGPHNIYITYGGLEVPGCPLTQNIQDVGGVTAIGEGLFKGEEDKPATFFVDTGGKRGDLFVQVDGPNSIAKCNIEPEHGGRYRVTYIPVEVGSYDVQIKWNGREIPGSPYHPKVVDSRKIIIVGGWGAHLDPNGVMFLMINEEKRLEFDCSLAGPGTLTGELRGPLGMHPMQIEHLGGGRFLVSFIPRTEGEHFLTLRWAETQLPKMPLMGICRSRAPVINHEMVVLTGRGLTEARIREEAEFIIDGTEAGHGTPTVKLTGVKCEVEVHITSLGGNKYRCTYTPTIPGAYLLNIMWSDRQVRGSPFKVNVIALGDASKVVCTGEGLKMGIMGKEIKSVIDTRRAGPGELTAHCMGPNRVAYCELYDHRDGTFTLNIKPQEPGRHVLQIKYGGDHVPGSPFVLRVSGAPDASKVRVYGPGVEHGILAMYQSRFICETRGAGAGQLTVRIRGPKGAFRVEMSRESQKDRTILCRYDPTEIGDYIIHVKWSGEHVPGSPFRVQVYDTSEELERFLCENPRERDRFSMNAPGGRNNYSLDM